MVCVTTGQVYTSLFDHNIEFSFKTEQTEASHSPQLNTPWNISHFRTLTTTNSVSDKYKHGGTVLTDNACFINSHRKYNFIFISPYLTTQELHYFHCFFYHKYISNVSLQYCRQPMKNSTLTINLLFCLKINTIQYNITQFLFIL